MICCSNVVEDTGFISFALESLKKILSSALNFISTRELRMVEKSHVKSKMSFCAIRQSRHFCPSSFARCEKRKDLVVWQGRKHELSFDAWHFNFFITLFLHPCRHKVQIGPTVDVRLIASICLKCVKLTMTLLFVLRDFCIVVYLPHLLKTQIVVRCHKKDNLYKGLDTLYQWFTQSSQGGIPNP